MLKTKKTHLQFAFLRRAPIKFRFFGSSSPSQTVALGDGNAQAIYSRISSSNRAIAGFARSGDLASARALFDGMTQRDVVTWNSMMSGYAHNGHDDQALETFSDMRLRGMAPSPTSFSIILSSCARRQALCFGKRVHGLVVKSGASGNVFVGTSLITMYAECYVPDCLMQAFDDVDHGNVASWNAVISGFVSNGRIQDAREFFDAMPCQNIVSWTAMINGYVGINKIRDAMELFNLMPEKNGVTWSVMLGGFISNRQFEEALAFFTDMLNHGVQATIGSVVKVLNACSGLKYIRQGKKIHAYAIKTGFDFDPCIEASLVSMYFRCLDIQGAISEFGKMEVKYVGSWNSLICAYMNYDEVDEARKWFNEMKDRDEVSWNSMINGYLRSGRTEDALELLSLMPKPTIRTFTALLSGFVENGKILEAKELFNNMPERDVMTCTIMVLAYLEEGSITDAVTLFENMPVRNAVTYNIMISGLVRHQKVKQAYELFRKSPVRDDISWNSLIVGFVQSGLNYEAFLLFLEMVAWGISPSESVIASLLSASARISMLTYGELIHAVAIKYGYEGCMVIRNSLINMYAKCGNMLTAKVIFDHMDKRDLVSWNAIIYGYAVNGLGEVAIEMFEKLRQTTTKPDGLTFLCVLSACMHNNLLEEARYYFDSMSCHHGIQPDLTHYTCLIDLLCRMGLVENAEKIIYSMPFKPDPVTWTSLLSGCRLNCNVRVAELAADQLIHLVPKDPMPYLHLNEVYVSSCQWADSDRLRYQLNKLGFNKRPGCSWIERKRNPFFSGDKCQVLSGEVS